MHGPIYIRSYSKFTVNNITNLLAEKKFRSFNLSLIRQHTINQSLSLFYPI